MSIAAMPMPPMPPDEALEPGEEADPSQPHEIENPGDPGPNVLVPPREPTPLGPPDGSEND